MSACAQYLQVMIHHPPASLLGWTLHTPVRLISLKYDFHGVMPLFRDCRWLPSAAPLNCSALNNMAPLCISRCFPLSTPVRSLPAVRPLCFLHCLHHPSLPTPSSKHPGRQDLEGPLAIMENGHDKYMISTTLLPCLYLRKTLLIDHSTVSV